jgi:hypothetical protein
LYGIALAASYRLLPNLQRIVSVFMHGWSNPKRVVLDELTFILLLQIYQDLPNQSDYEKRTKIPKD